MLDLNEKTHQLIEELIENFIYFLPTSILENDLIKRFNIDISIENYTSVLDEVIYFENGYIYKYKDKPLEQNFATQKLVKLKENIFNLFQLKETLKKDSFSFILETYLDQLRLYNSLSDLLLEKFDTHSPIKDSQLKSIFILQNHSLQNHLTEIEKNFSAKNVGLDSITKLFRNENMNEAISISEINDPISIPHKSNVNKKHFFRDFVLHEKKAEIENILIEKFGNIRGKQLRYLIEYLIDNNLITIVYGSRKKIYESLQNTLDSDIGTYKSMFGFTIQKGDSDYKNMKNEFIKAFKEVF